MKGPLTNTKAELLLIFLILARSTSFVMSKIGLRELETFTLLGFRFLLATVFLLPFIYRGFRKCTIGVLYKGMLVGIIYSGVMVAEIYALGFSGAGTVALFENTAIIMVPVIEAVLLRRSPKVQVVISTFMAFCGVCLMSMEDGGITFSIGEALGLISAVLFAIAIIVTDRVSKQDDPMMIGFFQVATMGTICMFAAFIFERPALPTIGLTWQMLLLLAIVCTGFGFTLQPLAQRYTSSDRTGLLFALNPIFAAILSWLVLGEHFGVTGVLGILLILSGMILPEVWKKESHAYVFRG